MWTNRENRIHVIKLCNKNGNKCVKQRPVLGQCWNVSLITAYSLCSHSHKIIHLINEFDWTKLLLQLNKNFDVQKKIEQNGQKINPPATNAIYIHGTSWDRLFRFIWKLFNCQQLDWNGVILKCNFHVIFYYG